LDQRKAAQGGMAGTAGTAVTAIKGLNGLDGKPSQPTIAKPATDGSVTVFAGRGYGRDAALDEERGGLRFLRPVYPKA